MYKTKFTTSKELTNDSWFLIDVTNQVLGKISATISTILMGKSRPDYAPNKNSKQNIIVINADKLIVSGKKEKQKTYYRHSTRPGHLKSIQYCELVKKDPTKPLYLAIKGMLPKNTLGKQLLRQLHIYGGSTHNHQAQKPRLIA